MSNCSKLLNPYTQNPLVIYIPGPPGPPGPSGLGGKGGVIPGESFSGTPLKYDVVFGTAYENTGYVISITGTDARNYTYDNDSKTVNGFTINANANQAIAGEVSWITQTAEN